MTSLESKRVRAFLAVEVAAPIHAAVVALRNELASTGAGVRWVGDAGLHATIKFLGAVEPDQIEAIARALTPIVGCAPAFTVRVRGLGVFPTLRRPRVIWVGLEGAEFPPLARAVEQTLAPLGFPPERRPFQPHLTLGRVQGARGWPRLETAMKVRWTDDFGSCVVRELIAYRSDLRPDGAIYTRLWTIPLEESKKGASHGA
ncbi:MAG: 2'-5' RNA ligase [Acidobacteria bacterium RBG_16_68_9]|nr:MAG: 2'-5' RNA ligase [Acidobacteria bacterium RBG_16_68_9]